MRKNLLLTLWLALPILVFSGLVAWIFLNGARPPEMDVRPIGPGAGDTGGANALGEWLAGRNPNTVERANIARRQGHAVDPFWWPGGTEVVVEVGDGPGVTGQRGISLGWIDAETGVLRAVVLRASGDGVWSAVLRTQRPDEGALVYLSRDGIEQHIRDGFSAVTNGAGSALVPISVRPVPTAGVAASEPLRVVLTLPE